MMNVKETVNGFFVKLPFKGLAEKIPARTRAKVPVLDKAIPFANQIVCGLVCVLVITIIACSGKGGGGGKPNPATDFSYDVTEDGAGILIKGYTGAPGKVVIPATIEDMPVLEIGEGAFDGSSLNFGAFMDSGRLADVKSEDNEKAGITAIFLPDTVRKIGRSAFANTAITSIVIPDSVTELAYSSMGHSFLFSGCNQLTEVHFSDNIEILPANLFGLGGSSSLTKVNLPTNLKIIAGGSTGSAFGSCTELTELIIPETLTSVEFAEGQENFYLKPAEFKWVKEGKTPWKGWQTQGTINAFNGCTKLPLKIRQQLKDMGYNGEI